jgi:dihydrofolate synthase/folylpolyglutamate synthase
MGFVNSEHANPEYQRALRFLDSVVDLEKLRHHPGAQPYRLERMRMLLERMGLPRPPQRFVQVLGSKGKGSTSVMMESVLGAAGYRVGLFSKPHLFSPRERIRVAGRTIDESSFAAAAAQVEQCGEDIAIPGDGKVTYFEAITAMAIWVWAEAEVAVGVLEAGLGGRLDATSTVDSLLSVITRIDLEHTEVLGHTLGAIAAEKAAVIGERGLAVSSPQEPEAREVITAEALRKAALLFLGGADFSAASVRCSVSGTTFKYQGIFDDLDEVTVPLLGAHQAENAASALAACECLRDFCGFRIDERAMRAGLATVEWPARVQLVQAEPPVIVDSAHTGRSAQALAEVLQTVFPGCGVVFVLGVSADKNFARIIEPLAPLARRVIATQSSHPRALAAEQVAAACAASGLKVDVRPSPEEALRAGLESLAPDELLCVTGSLFVAAEALEAWRRRAGGGQGP